MPVYEYVCTECGEPLEARQSFTDAALTVCPNCSGRLRKKLSPVGVVFKGSGFYRNDSREAAASALKGAGANGDTKDATEKSGSEKGGSEKGDKSATKEAIGSGTKESAPKNGGSGSSNGSSAGSGSGTSGAAPGSSSSGMSSTGKAPRS